MDIITTLRDEQGNNVFPRIKLYLHKMYFVKAFGNYFELNFAITNASSTEYNKETIKKFITTPMGATGRIHVEGEGSFDINKFYVGSDDDENDLVIEYGDTDTFFTYTSNDITFHDEVIPL